MMSNLREVAYRSIRRRGYFGVEPTKRRRRAALRPASKGLTGSALLRQHSPDFNSLDAMQSLSIERDELILLCIIRAHSAPTSLAPSQPHARASAVFLNEIDASGFQGVPNYFQSCSTRFIQSALELTNGHDANSGSICKLLLCPLEESAGRPAL
jgi:hypothetical protein